MNRFLKIAAVSLGVLLLLVGAGVAGLYAWSGAELKKKLTTPTHAFTAPTAPDSALLARGKHVVDALAKCSECHTADLGGGTMIDDAAFGHLATPNLTSGAGGIGADYTDADWERAVRHGVARDGRRLMIMPSNEYQYLSDEDLGVIVAYLRSVPAVDRETAPTQLGPLPRALYAAGKFPLFPAAFVTHTDAAVPTVPVDSTVEYGQYLGTVGCSGCHGATYGGGNIPGTPPEWPAAANLTPTGIGHYAFTDFATLLKTGIRPDGSKLEPFMPIAATSQMTEIEMKAVFAYLKTLPARPFGTR